MIRQDLATTSFRFLLFWAMLLSLSFLLFIFLHECAHGLGSKLEGISVSTGFNRVGDVGKRASDPTSGQITSFPASQLQAVLRVPC